MKRNWKESRITGKNWKGEVGKERGETEGDETGSKETGRGRRNRKEREGRKRNLTRRKGKNETGQAGRMGRDGRNGAGGGGGRAGHIGNKCRLSGGVGLILLRIATRASNTTSCHESFFMLIFCPFLSSPPSTSQETHGAEGESGCCLRHVLLLLPTCLVT